MTIHLLDILIYILLLMIIIGILGEEYTTELGELVGLVVFLFYTVIYCVVFYYYDWIDIIKYINIKL
jgi:hypothetical protein